MSRCRSCNRRLEGELLSTLDNGDVEDMCYVCLGQVYNEYSYLDDHEYVQGNLKAGLTSPILTKE